jgi:hypothetical protein
VKPTIKNDCTHAYVGMGVLVAIFMLLFIAVMHGQELSDAPQAAIKHQIPPVHKQTPLLAKHVNSTLGSADWFRERGYFKLARIMPVLQQQAVIAQKCVSPCSGACRPQPWDRRH